MSTDASQKRSTTKAQHHKSAASQKRSTTKAQHHKSAAGKDLKQVYTGFKPTAHIQGQEATWYPVPWNSWILDEKRGNSKEPGRRNTSLVDEIYIFFH